MGPGGGRDGFKVLKGLHGYKSQRHWPIVIHSCDWWLLRDRNIGGRLMLNCLHKTTFTQYSDYRSSACIAVMTSKV